MVIRMIMSTDWAVASILAMNSIKDESFEKETRFHL